MPFAQPLRLLANARAPVTSISTTHALVGGFCLGVSRGLSQDDFAAICEVAGGHKRFNPAAAGRFGIGFNTAYFLTDTPLLFSRREVHIFDLRRSMFNANGWRFPVDEFPAAASNAGAIKNVLDWVLPKAVLGDVTFQELANSGQDYQETVFRLPLRQTLSNGSNDQRDPVYSSVFPGPIDRENVLQQMCEEAKRSLLFLKSVRCVVFGAIVEKHFDEWARVEASPQSPRSLADFVDEVRSMSHDSLRVEEAECSFRCDVSLTVKTDRVRLAPGSASFLVTYAAGFKNDDLRIAERLDKDKKRAAPWVAVAFPIASSSVDWEGPGDARWRVFLPLSRRGRVRAF